VSVGQDVVQSYIASVKILAEVREILLASFFSRQMCMSDPQIKALHDLYEQETKKDASKLRELALYVATGQDLLSRQVEQGSKKSGGSSSGEAVARSNGVIVPTESTGCDHQLGSIISSAGPVESMPCTESTGSGCSVE
jgi:hypothetical protein